MEPTSTAPRCSQAARWLLLAAWTAVALFCALRFLHLSADFPNNSPWNIDQSKFTDEGWWASGAIAHHLLGRWTVPGDYNPVVAVPVWPALLGLLFHFTGVSVIATRALNVVLSIVTLGIVYALIRRCTLSRPTLTATFVVLLLASSPFAYAFSRLATLETIVALEFCLLLLLATFAADRRVLYLATPALIAAMVLTKTTSIVLLPAIFWLAWQTTGGKLRSLLPASISVIVLPAILFKAYVAIIFHRGFAADYNYFFAANDSYDIDWSHLLPCLRDLLQDGLWVDRVLYPATIVALLYAILWKRSLWRNPLFTASCLALAGQIVFLLGRDGDVAPRYLFLTLFPIIFIVVLTLETLRGRTAITISALLLLATPAVNTATLASFQRHRTTDFMQAANSIRDIVNHDASHNHLLLGISASQISLMTGLSSINDTYGTEPLPEKVLRYQPGWYVAWIGIGPDQAAALAPFHVEESARYRVFDDDDRNTLILYRLTLIKEVQTGYRQPEPQHPIQR